MNRKEVSALLFSEPRRRRSGGDAPRAVTSPAPVLAGPPVVRRDGDEFVFTWPEHGVTINVARVRETHAGLEGELLIRSIQLGELHWGRLVLASTSGRETLVKKLQAAAEGLPWRVMLEYVCRHVAEEVSAGSPVVTLEPAPLPVQERFLLKPLVPENATAVLYGDGGVGKGWVALLVALSVASGTPVPGLRPTRQAPVLYLDWESEEQDARERLALLAAGLRLDNTGTILYRQMVRSLADDIARIRAEAARAQVGLVIVDSYTPACGKDPETAGAADLMFNALRSLAPASRLVIAHLSKSAAEQRAGAAQPWGSVFVKNLARMTWEIRSAEESGPDLTVGMFCRKINRGRPPSPVGLHFSFTEQAVAVRSHEVAEDPELAARMSLGWQLQQALRSGSQTVEDLVEYTGATPDVVRVTLHRLRRAGKVIPAERAPGKPTRWGLPARNDGELSPPRGV